VLRVTVAERAHARLDDGHVSLSVTRAQTKPLVTENRRVYVKGRGELRIRH